MDYKVLISASTVRDLEIVVESYDEEESDEVLAEKGSELLEKVVELVCDRERGRVVPEFQQPELREVLSNGYRIVYRVNDAQRCLEIVRILQDKQRPARANIGGSEPPVDRNGEDIPNLRGRGEIMRPKEMLAELAERLPPGASLFDAIRELEFKNTILRGLASLDNEPRVTPQDAAKLIPQWITKYFSRRTH